MTINVFVVVDFLMHERYERFERSLMYLYLCRNAEFAKNIAIIDSDLFIYFCDVYVQNKDTWKLEHKMFFAFFKPSVST